MHIDIQLNKVQWLAVALLFLFGCSASETDKQLAERLSLKYGIEIRSGAPETMYLDPYGYDDVTKYGAEIYQASPENVHDALLGIDKALSVYPDQFVSGLIGGIFIAGKIKFDGVRAGGTYGPSWIILATSDDTEQYLNNVSSVQFTTHHELSSFVYRQNPTLELMWGTLLPNDWQPVDSYVQALTPIDENISKLNQQGFLSYYGSTSVENDFNTFAEMVFVQPDELRALALRHKVIAQKMRLLMNCYSQIDPRMNRYFETHALNQVDADPVELSFSPEILAIKGEVL